MTLKTSIEKINMCMACGLLLILLFSSAASAKIYYLENNATIQSLGADGNTDYNISGTTITSIPYNNLLKNGTMGSQANLRYTTSSTTTEYEVFRFYLPINYTKDTRIFPNTPFTILWRGAGTSPNGDTIVNVSLIEYNPATGEKTVIGNRTFIAQGGSSTTTYSYQINHPVYTIQQGNMLILRINSTTPTTTTVRLYFNDQQSNIAVTEIPEGTFLLSGYVTDKTSGLPISGVTVQANSTFPTTTTDANGLFTFAGLSNGTYTINASVSGYVANSTTTAINGADVDNVNISLLSLPPNWRLILDSGIDQPSNYSTSFTPKVWLMNQSGNTVSGASVTCSYWNVNNNSASGLPCTATDNLDGSYSGSPINMPIHKNRYINVLFQVTNGAGSNALREQHSFYADESSPAHGAVWKIEVVNASLGPSFNGSRVQRIYMKLYSDAALPYRNNQNTTRYVVKDSSGVAKQSGFMTYEEDGIYSFNTTTNYINGGKYYFELISNWTGRPTGSTGSTPRNTSAIAGFYLQANNTMSDNVPPEIVATKRKPYFPVDDDLVTVIVDALDNNDISSAHLHYSVNHKFNETLTMTKQTKLEYSAQIPVFMLEDNVRYWVEVEDGTNNVTSEEFMYNVQDRRGSANMSHSFLSHPVYWFGKSRQANFLDRGGDTNFDGTYSTSEIDRVVYLSTPPDYQYFKDMTRIKVQTMIMDETGKPIQHLTNVKAWLSNNTMQPPGTHNREKIMTEVSGESGVYTATWEGSANVSGSSLVWNDDAKAIWGNYTSGEVYSVFIDANNDSMPEENITWLAYNFGDTLWGASGLTTFSSHSNLETPGATCGSYGSCHTMTRDITTRTTTAAGACPDCHGVYKNANNGIWPISGNTAATNQIIYGNSTSHPRQNITNDSYCGDESCHNLGMGTRFPSSSTAFMEIPGYDYGTRINGTFRATYPNPMQCAEHHDYKEAKIPNEEGHNKMVGCKYCHGGSHANFKLQDFNTSAMGTISTIEKGTPGYVGTGGVNGSGTYAGDCYKDCHKTQVEHSLTGMPGGATQNAFVPCDECHKNFNKAAMHQEDVFPYPDRQTCGGCHQSQGAITTHNTSLTIDPPRIPSPQQHATPEGDAWNSTGMRPYWVENEQSCRFCHGRSYNEAYGLGRVENFMGTNIINGTINSTSYWCSSCHVNTSSQNYENMVNVYNYSFGVVPPEITGSTWKSDRAGYKDHGIDGTINKSDPGTYSDNMCFGCHGGSVLQSAGFDALQHKVSVSDGSDTTPPTVISIVRSGSDPTNMTTIIFTVTFSESVTGVDSSDFTLATTGISGDSISTVSGSGETYALGVNTGTGDGTIRLDVVDDDSILDAASNPLGGTGTGNGNFSTGEFYSIDKTSPTVTVNQASGQSDPTGISPINFTVVFSENVNDFANSGVTLSGSAGATTATVTGAGTIYNVEVTGMSTSGTVIATIGAGVARDNASNANEASTSIDNIVTYDISVPSYIPPTPSGLTPSQNNFWVNYTWTAGAGENITDSYNVSLNSGWSNNTITFRNNTVGPHGWSNITVYAYNNSGPGQLNLTPATMNTQVINNVPVLGSIGDKTVTAGDLLTFTILATDADSDTLTNATNASKGTFTPSSFVFTWTPEGSDAGTYLWTFNSSDVYGGVASETITVTVNAIPTYMPPTPSGLTPSQNNFWVNYTWTAGAGENITDSYNVSLNSGWSNNTITFRNNTVGPHGWSNITIYAYNNSGTGQLNLTPATMNTQVINNVPVLGSIGDKTVTAGDLLTFTILATDADSDTLTNATNASKGTFTPSSFVFTWTPEGSDAGTYLWTFNSSDVYGGVASETITVTVNAIPTYSVSGYVFDNIGSGLLGVTVKNDTTQSTTIQSGYYFVSGLINGSYNFSYNKTGFNTGYLEVAINGANNTTANNTIFDTSAPGQVTLGNDTPAQTTVNLSWNGVPEANYYQVFRNSTSLGYTQNIFWNDTGLNAGTTYQYQVRANDTYDNWGLNSTILSVTTASQSDTTPPASVTGLVNVSYAQNYINWTWTEPSDSDFEKVKVYLNGVFKEDVLKGIQFYNVTVTPGTYTIGTRTVDTNGNINATMVTHTATTILPSVRYINGTVIDSINKTGIMGVTVSTNTSLSTKTDVTGFYSFTVISGAYELTAKLDPTHYTNNTVSVSTIGSAVVWQDIELIEKPKGTITGSVKDI